MLKGILSPLYPIISQVVKFVKGKRGFWVVFGEILGGVGWDYAGEFFDF